MAVVYLALGSNLGDRAENISRALEELEKAGIHINKRSSVIETEPVGGPPQGKYLNAVIECHTGLSPDKLLEMLQEVEILLGRERSIKDGPRTIDLDILLYDQIQMNTTTLTIPHPRMYSRDFVLVPLKEIYPGFSQENS